MEFLAHSGRARGKKASLDIPTSESEAKSDTAAPTTPTQGSLPDQDSPSGSSSVSATLFRAYDIRGVVGDTLDTDIVYLLGRAIGSEAQACGEQTVIIARDGRHSSELLSEALSRGLVESGREVVDLGLVPTPVVYFATHFLGSNSGVMVTGSHNPPEYNGLKIVIGGEALAEGRIKDLHRRIQEGDLVSGTGARREQDLLPDYISRISEDVQLLTPMKVVVDCGNGVSSVVAPALLRVLGCDVVELFCHVDGNFPNHHPDPGDPRNLQALIDCVRNEGADLGIALDGDGDRLGIVDSQGNIIWPDRLLMLLARDVLLRQPGADVIYDVKSSRHLASEILTYGGRPIMWKSGHSLIKEKMRETGAVLAGELTGHIYFQERWYGFDDGLYAAARLLEVLSGEGVSSAEVFAQLPESVSTAELHAPVGEGRGPSLVGALLERGQFPDAKLVTIDGIRAEFQDGWGLVRPSNTGPNLVFRFEADDKVALTRIQGIFRDQLSVIDTTLELPF
ncbi:MAG: phosphomannomutase/phosphoglucomutase [Gammaproteobacteria bacterium]|nr:phosphomannomutase/phosphoglucomutase [Gammaproteobacteria bacterium]